MSANLHIPVRYTARPGPSAGLVIERSPTVEAAIGYEGKSLDIRALIDTGADEIYVDKQILLSCGCLRVGTVTVRSAHRTQEQERFRADLIFPNNHFRGEVEVIAHEWDPPRVYNAIFGTRFLEVGRLVLDPTGDSYFTFHERMTAAPTP